jgi:hypothetical protein
MAQDLKQKELFIKKLMTGIKYFTAKLVQNSKLWEKKKDGKLIFIKNHLVITR